MNAVAILATMIALLAPGQSMYSMTPVAEGSPAACSNEHSLLCRAPVWSEAHKSWVRPETREEGIARYWTIAQGIEKAGQGDEHLTRLVLMVTYFESGWRRDVHSGIGKASKGDKGKSWCLGQHLLGPNGNRTVPGAGYKVKDLVGVDQASTNHCLMRTAKVIQSSRGYCAMRGLGRLNPTCTFGVYAGLSAGSNRFAKRGFKFAAVAKSAPALPAVVRQQLGLEPEPNDADDPPGPVATYD